MSRTSGKNTGAFGYGWVEQWVFQSSEWEPKKMTLVCFQVDRSPNISLQNADNIQCVCGLHVYNSVCVVNEDDYSLYKCLKMKKTRWWFQIFFICNPYQGK